MRADGNLQWDDHYPNRAGLRARHRPGRASGSLEPAVAQEFPGAIAAVTAITTDQSPEYAQVGWDITEPAIVVHRLAVDPAHRGAGLAIALMQQAEAVARAGGISVLRVDTNTENPATQRLFPKLGYTLAGEISLNFRPGLRFPLALRKTPAVAFPVRSQRQRGVI